MGLHDTFDFDAVAYREKCASRPTVKLQEEEIKKLRQHFAASASVAIGLSHAVHTAGLTLGVSAWGLRRYYVAREKLTIIREELTTRGVPLHDMDKRDAAIPLGASLAGLGLGAGIGHLVGGVMAPPSGVPLPMPGAPEGSAAAAMHLIQADPTAAAHGFAHGASDHASAVGHAAHDLALGHGLGGGEALAQHAAAEVGSNLNIGDGGHAVGYAAGVLAAKQMDEVLGECVGETVFAYSMEKLLDPTIKVQLQLQGKCSRLQGPLGQCCRGCGESIRYGKFARKEHFLSTARNTTEGVLTLDLPDCCSETDDFDMCLKCHEGGNKCPCSSDRPMSIIQKSVAGDVLISEKGDSRRRLATVSDLRCTTCQKVIMHGRYYCNKQADCAECGDSEKDFDMCQDCYRQGETCSSPDKHRFYVYLRSNVDRAHPDFAADVLACKECKTKVKQGPVHICGECGDDSCLCDRCFDMEKSCPDSDHIMTRYVVYKGEKRISKTFTEKDRCQFCKEQLGGSTFYCCRKCNKGCYDICGKCYVQGAGCKDRSHDLLKCTPSEATKQPIDFVRELLKDSNKEQMREYWNEQRNRISWTHK